MRFGVLGPVTVWDGDGNPVPVPGTKVRALLALLLVHRATVVPTGLISDALWGERPPAKVDAVLRSKVSQLRQVLRAAGGNGTELLRRESGGYCLRVAAAEVDAEHFAELLAAAQRSPSPRTALELLATAEACWRGEPFADFRDELFVLATSREPLRIAGERVLPLAPLSFPAGDDPGTGDPSRFGAYTLFVQRITDAGGRAPATTGENAVALRICRRLDGLPLALELAAARVHTLGLETVDRLLADRFALLTSRTRAGPDRQRTLWNAIAWSWELATVEQQDVLRRLSCADSVTVAAAEAVTGVSGTEAREIVSRLVEQSLLVVEHGPDGPRYRMLESVREFARARLAETGAEPETLRRHRDYYTRLLDRQTALLRTRDQGEALRCLREESGNLRIALTGAERPLPMVVRLMWFWMLTGRLTEAAGWLAASMPTAEPGSAAARVGHCWVRILRLRIAAADRAGTVLAEFGDHPEATGAPAPGPLHEEECLARWYLAVTRRVVGVEPAGGDDGEFRAPAGEWGVAATTLVRALDALQADRCGVAAVCAEDSVSAFRAIGDRWGVLQALDVLVRAGAELTGTRRCDELDRWALTLAEELGLRSDISRILSRRGRRALLAGDLEGARPLFLRARDIAGEQCDGTVCAEAEGGLSAVDAGLTGVDAQRRITATSDEYLRILCRSDFHAHSPAPARQTA